MHLQPELSIVMPCLNEALTLPSCLEKAQRFLEEHEISGEVIVADNGSTDGSIEIAESLNARVVRVPRRGYGAALAAGIEAAKGRYVIMGDSDESYDFSALSPFVDKLRAGYDLVMGNRYLGGIARENEMKALAVGGAVDHVHTLISLPGTLSVAKALQLLKGNSSKWIHETFPNLALFGWQEGYGAFSIGVSGVEATRRYIRNQAEHHRKQTFRQELEAMLRKHGLEYAERMLD